MTTDLERAAKAYRKAESALEQRRLELAAAIVEATQAKLPQTRIVQATGYTRETIRRIVRTAEES